MSFGFGIGDFLAVFELATKVRDRWTDAPIEYKSIKDGTKNIKNILSDIGEIGTRINLSNQHEIDLNQVCTSCREVLEECEKLVKRYSSIQGPISVRFKVRRAWKRLQADPDDIRHLRERMSAVLIQLNSLFNVIETDLIIDAREGVQDLQLSDAQHERKMVADWYSPTDFANQQNDQLSSRQGGTGGWFLNHNEYQKWRQQANSTLLCPGIPGSGKSVMVAAVVEDLQTYLGANKDFVVAYLYCNFKRQAEQDLRRMLASLTRQLFQEQAQLPDIVTALYEKHRDRATHPSVDELKQVLRLLVASYRRVFIVIDALDECGNMEQQRDQLLNELFSLQKLRSSNVNLLATTRFIPDVSRQFSGHPQIEIRAHEDDIQAYLASRMTKLAKFVLQDNKLQEEIKNRVVNAAEGMFLLARLQFESLQDKTSRGHMRKALDRLQKGSHALDEQYDKAMDRVNHQSPAWRNLALRVLLWITYATRQLSIDELREAIAIDTEDEDFGHQSFDLYDYLSDEDQIVSLCHGLVEIDQGSRIVRLVHYTTQEYFEKTRGQWLPEGHTRITRDCIAYLSMRVFAHGQCEWGKDLSTTVQQHKFLEYAAKNWGVHARAVRSEDLMTNITNFLLNPDLLRFSTMVTLGHRDYFDDSYCCNISDISTTHISSYFDLHHILRQLIQRGEDINHRDSARNTPLSRAAEQGHTRTVRLLLAQPGIEVNARDEFGDTPLSRAAGGGHIETIQLLLAQPGINVNTGSPLSRAAWRGYKETVQLLLGQDGVDVNTRDNFGATPLPRAAEGGYIEIIQLLLSQPGIEVNTKDEFGDTPLSRAAKEGHTETVRLLLAQHGVDVNAKDDSGVTPLSIAAWRGHTETVQLLLTQPGIEVNAKDEFGATSLSRVAEQGRIETVRLLLAQPGIEVNARNEFGDTSLSIAAEGGHTETVKLLLAHHGVDVNTKSKYSYTPLSRAAEGGYSEIVQLLLAQHGVEVNARDEFGATPLSIAALRGHTEIIQLLLAQPGIEVNAKDKYSTTPLSRAAEQGRIETVRLLLAQPGIEVNARDEFGDTPLSIAAEGRHIETIQLLLTQPGIEVNVGNLE